MKKLLATVATTALMGTTAFAADMPVKAPYAPAPAPISWTGWYAGFNFGGTWGGDGTTVNSVKTFECGTLTTGCLNAFPGPTGTAAALAATGSLGNADSGFIGGGQIGYNFQFSPALVAGFEADIQGVSNKKTVGQTNTVEALSSTSLGSFPGNTVTVTTNADKDLDWFGTVRGRLGWLWTPSWLFYGTGGLAYGHVSSNTSISGFTSGVNLGLCCGPMTFASAGGFSETRTGWTAGGGFEWLMAANWSAKFEYLYYDLGSVSYSAGSASAITTGGVIGPGVTAFTIGSQASTRFNGNIVRVGLNYHF